MSVVTDRIEAHVWRLSAVVMLGSIMSILDTTIVNVALQTLGHDLHSTISEIQWVVTGYMLALAAVIPVTGWAARRFGAKQVYLTSLVLFTGGSALCGLSGSATMLVVARVLQGTEELTWGLDVVPSTRQENLPRLEAALRDLDARRADGKPLQAGTIGTEPAIASLGDLSRMLASLGREEDMPKLLDLRRLAELEISHGIEI